MNYTLDVKPYREKMTGGCGPASLKIVLDYYGLEKSEEELFLLCGTDTKLGTPAENLQKAAEGLGFTVTIKDHCTFDDIAAYLEKKVPVIVDWFTRGRNDYTDSDIADGHYSVVAQLDDDYIHLQDPELGALRKMSREDFMIVWFDFKGKYIDPNELVIRQIIAIEKK